MINYEILLWLHSGYNLIERPGSTVAVTVQVNHHPADTFNSL